MHWIRGLDRNKRAALVMAVIFCAVSAIFVIRQATPGIYWDGQFLKRTDVGRYENDAGYEITLVETNGDTSRFTYRVPAKYSLDGMFYSEFEEWIVEEPDEEEDLVGKSGEAVLTASPIHYDSGMGPVSVTYGPDELTWKGFAEYGGSLTGYEGSPTIYEDSWFLEGDGRMLYEPPPQVLYSIAKGQTGTRGNWWMVFVAAPFLVFWIVAYLYPVQVRLFGSRWAYDTEPVFSDEAIMLMRGGAIAGMVLTTMVFYLLPI